MPKYPDLVFDRDLSGPDGNVFAVIGRIRQMLESVGADAEAFTAEVNATHSYADALRVCGEWVTMPEEAS